MNIYRSNKKKHNYLKILVSLGIIYLAAVLGFAFISYRVIASNTEKELGDKAKIVAIDIAEMLRIDESEFNRLLSLDFDSLLKDKVNFYFQKRSRVLMKFSDIKYIYLECPIPDEKVKYYVEKDETDIYNMPEGTPLNVVYLLDAVLDEQTRLNDTDGKWYTDKDRYTVMSKQFKEIYSLRHPVVIINSDQWGTYITGYAPYYNSKQEYIGLIGVDLFLDRYLSYLRRYIIILSGFTFTLLFIGIFALYLIVKVRKVEDLVEKKSILSDIDGLTSLLNRRCFLEFLEDHWEKNKRNKTPLSLLLIDVDYFKEFNDNYGHLAGDELLMKIAGILKAGVRHDYDYVGRYGGDEFIIMLENTNLEEAQIIAENLLNKVRELKVEHNYSKNSSIVTISLGCSTQIPDEKSVLEDFFHQADNALYTSKENGKNQIQFWNESISDKLHRPFFPEV